MYRGGEWNWWKRVICFEMGILSLVVFIGGGRVDFVRSVLGLGFECFVLLFFRVWICSAGF